MPMLRRKAKTKLTLGGLVVGRRDLGDLGELKTQLACEHTHTKMVVMMMRTRKKEMVMMVMKTLLACK